MEFFRLRIIDDGEEIAAQATTDRLHESKGGVGGDGSVNGRTTGLEHVESDLGRKRLTGAYHTVLRDDF